ncbi:unnamed protein product [Brachionus calyciflorus]|uniref:Major facilitator superfamily (MFS) profile domain-containing protein n=1 Tax=Brachionus calyciflorus TaxID=104777 RepID=A0A813Y538_9BILA|nr:unnamed protein product [Brachionus calyciflorus]
MGFENDNEQIYKNLTDSKTPKTNDKWTLYLVLCVLTVTSASFQFGYNISSMNSPAQILNDFIFNHTFLFQEYFDKKALFELNEGWLIGNKTKYEDEKYKYEERQVEYLETYYNNDEEKRARMDKEKAEKEELIRQKYNKSMTVDELFEYLKVVLENKTNLLEEKRVLLENGRQRVLKATDYLWIITNCLFVVGGMLGAFTSKYVLDILGRKKGILFHNLFSISASILVFVSYYVKSPICLIISRLLFGIQGGMSCSLIPTYLSEISPAALRGQTGVAHQLCLTFGILIAQILGFRQILGNIEKWNYLLAFPIVPAVVGSLALLIFFPETPKALLITKDDKESARKALQLLRNRINVNSDLDEIENESKSSNQSQDSVSFGKLLTSSKLRWPLITSLVLQMAQQLCGINAIFFYSESIFKNSGIDANFIQYAVLATGLVNFIATIVCTQLIDRLGRKPLLVFPMIVIIVNFILLTTFLKFQSPDEVLIPFLNIKLENGRIFSYLSIVCIAIFIVCFAIGLGPIPFIYVTEVFRQNARGSALALCMLTNWLANLFLTLFFPILAQILKHYVFIIFAVIVFFSVVIIIVKVPETKGRSTEEIINKLNKNKSNNYEKSERLMSSYTKA